MHVYITNVFLKIIMWILHTLTSCQFKLFANCCDSCPITLLTLLGEFCCEGGEPIKGLGAAGGRGGGGRSTLLRVLLFVSGVAGAEQVLLWGCKGDGLGERHDLGSDERPEGEEPGLLIDGSDTLLVNGCSCSVMDDRGEAVAVVRGKPWSDEEEERLSVLRAGEGQAEED